MFVFFWKFFYHFIKANANITQTMLMFESGPEKWKWLTNRLVEFTAGMSGFWSVVLLQHCFIVHFKLLSRKGTSIRHAKDQLSWIGKEFGTRGIQGRSIARWYASRSFILFSLESCSRKSTLLRLNFSDDRNKVINEFKKGDMPVLVATDVAGKRKRLTDDRENGKSKGSFI